MLSAAEGICGWSSSGYHWAFLLSAGPCVLRCTCGFSMGVPVVSVYGFLCVWVSLCACGGTEGRTKFSIDFPDSHPELKTQSENAVKRLKENCCRYR